MSVKAVSFLPGQRSCSQPCGGSFLSLLPVKFGDSEIAARFCVLHSSKLPHRASFVPAVTHRLQHCASQRRFVRRDPEREAGQTTAGLPAVGCTASTHIRIEHVPSIRISGRKDSIEQGSHGIHPTHGMIDHVGHTPQLYQQFRQSRGLSSFDHRTQRPCTDGDTVVGFRSCIGGRECLIDPVIELAMRRIAGHTGQCLAAIPGNVNPSRDLQCRVIVRLRQFGNDLAIANRLLNRVTDHLTRPPPPPRGPPAEYSGSAPCARRRR